MHGRQPQCRQTQGFELSAQRIGILMRDKFNLGFVDVGGWDTHVNQGGADGYLAARIGELGRGLALLTTRWARPGTTPLSSWSASSAAPSARMATAAPIMAMAAPIGCWAAACSGGRIAGPQLTVTQANLFQDRDWQVLNDYRSLIGGVLKSHGLIQAQLATDISVGAAAGYPCLNPSGLRREG